MSRYISIIGGTLFLLSSGCNGVAFESMDDGTLVNVRVGDLSYFVRTNLQGTENIQVVAVNQRSTICLDGEPHPFCEVDAIDFSYADMNEDTAADYERSFLAGKGVILGWMELGYEYPRDYLIAKLYTVEGWVDPTPGTLHTTVYEVSPVDLWCVRAPCPEYQADVLNAFDSTLLHEVDLYASEAPEQAVARGYSQLAHDHILIGGTVDEYMGGADDVVADEPLPGTRTLSSNTFYLRVSDR